MSVSACLTALAHISSLSSPATSCDNRRCSDVEDPQAHAGFSSQAQIGCAGKPKLATSQLPQKVVFGHFSLENIRQLFNMIFASRRSASCIAIYSEDATSVPKYCANQKQTWVEKTWVKKLG